MRQVVIILAALAILGGVWAGIRGLRLFARGLRSGDDPRCSLWVIRGLRGIIVWLCLTSLALGAVLEQVWLLVFGGLWLLEEIYETGVLALILRSATAGRAAQKDDSPSTTDLAPSGCPSQRRCSGGHPSRGRSHPRDPLKSNHLHTLFWDSLGSVTQSRSISEIPGKDSRSGMNAIQKYPENKTA